MENKNLKYALEYAKRGWKVFPLHIPIFHEDGTISCSCYQGLECKSIGKHPKTKHGLHDATCDLNQVKQWWEENPESNIGILCDRKFGLVIDIDPRNGGDVSLQQLKNQYGEFDCLIQQTGGGGYHLLLQYPEEDNFQPKGKLAEGIDIKKEGGYIVAEPSIHSSGKLYKWDRQNNPFKRTPPPIPSWLKPLLEKGNEHPKTGNQHQVSHHHEEDIPKSSAYKVTKQCGFLKECHENAETLSYHQWIKMIQLLSHAHDGERYIHQLSEPYSGYSFEETQRKIESIFKLGHKPLKCQTIQGEFGNHFCQGCRLKDSGTTPLVLGYPDEWDIHSENVKAIFEIIELDHTLIEDEFYLQELINDLTFMAKKYPLLYPDFKNKYEKKINVVKHILKRKRKK